jgi:integrase
MTITDILKANRPNLSEGSLKTYSSLIKGIGKMINVEIESPSDVITHQDDILRAMKDQQPSVRKTRLSALIVFIEKDVNAHDAIHVFRTLLLKDQKAVNAADDLQEKTEKQKVGMIPMADVEGKYKELEREVKPIMALDQLTAAQFQKVQLYVLLSCILLIPPRRSLDWTEFRLRGDHLTEGNYMTMQKRKPVLVFNVYKTARKTGQDIQPLPPSLAAILKRWMAINPHEFLLMNVHQTGKINSSIITRMLHQFFGLPISTSMIRHIYASDKHANAPKLKELRETAAAMAHDVITHLKYIKH